MESRRLGPNELQDLFLEEADDIVSPLPSEEESENEDEILHIEEEEDEEDDDDNDDELVPNDESEHVFGKDGTVWNTLPIGNVRGLPLEYRTVRESCGPIGAAKEKKNIEECWAIFLPDSMLDNIVKHTNSKITTVKHNYSSNVSTPTSIVELKAVIGLLYLLGYYKSNRMALSDFFEKDGTGIEVFRAAISLKRFRFLLDCLRFDDMDTRDERKKIDKLAPIRDVVDEFANTCRSNYCHSENVTVDEMLPSFRGRCGFKVYIPSKPNKYGIKIFAVVDAKTKYMSNMEIYTGVQPSGPFSVDNSAKQVVKRLLLHMKGSGRNVTMDNWFTSYSLAKELLDEYQISLVGTIRRNRREIPPEFTTTRGRAQFSSVFGHQKEATLVSYTAKKNKNVVLLSTKHKDANIDEDTMEKQKPEIITFYNRTKGGVDTLDQLCSLYGVERKTRRWPMVIFYSILNIAGVNAYVTFKSNGGSVSSRRDFIKKLGMNLIQDQLEYRRNLPGLAKDIKHSIAFIRPLPKESIQPGITEASRVRCNICPRGKDIKTKYRCAKCSSAVCRNHLLVLCTQCSATHQEDENETEEV